MAQRGALLTHTIGAGTACLLFVACSSKSSTSGSGGLAVPPGTTVVTSAPYPVCTTLEPGSFVTANDGGNSYPVPSTTSCTPAGTPTTGPADMHCAGVTPQPVNGADCDVQDAGAAPTGDDSGAEDDGSAGDSGSAGGDAGGAAPSPGPCDENGTDGAYGSTMFGTEGDDDDCKYHVSYTVSPLCENNDTYFVVTANYLTRDGASLTGASTFAEVCLSDTHPGPNIDTRPPYGNQEVVEGPPGTYTIGPVQFDKAGTWTVRFHFNEFCCDVAPDSPHGHAAFFISVP